MEQKKKTKNKSYPPLWNERMLDVKEKYEILKKAALRYKSPDESLPCQESYRPPSFKKKLIQKVLSPVSHFVIVFP